MKQAERDQFIARKYALAEWLCVPEYIMLKTLQTAMLHADTAELPDYGEALEPDRKVHGSHAGAEARERFCEEHQFLVADMAGEFFKLGQVVLDIPSLDVWLKALVEWQLTCVGLMTKEACKKRKKRKQKLR